MKRLALATLLALTACEAPAPAQKAVEGNAGTLSWAVGSTKGEIRLSRVENKLEDGVLRIRAWGPTAIADPSGAPRVPVVLYGEIPAGRDVASGDAGGFGMTATIPNAQVGDGEPVPILKLMARDAAGIDADWECRTKGRREIVCNKVHVMPSAPETGAFRAVFGFN